MKIRTRYAPSPTGKMHVGNLRTALYEYLIAKHEGGDFMLRIEDTDQERYVEGAIDIIYRTMAKAGLIHDEGPDKDKGFGPYIQSERMATGIYLEYAKKLIDKGEAYYCFCTKERLESLKSVAPGSSEGIEITQYDKHCLTLSEDIIKRNLEDKVPYVIRQNVPREGSTTFSDIVYGDITVENSELEDMILIKSDGYPTYNFANVVDDHLMEITHVVRGNEYLSSTPKYTRLYNAFGWEEPKYIHCPIITDENHKKLSKRCGHSSFEELLEQGFLPEAVVNFIALLGWSPNSTKEIFSKQELIENFDYRRINKAPAVFDMVKLRWMNGEYIKALEDDCYYDYVMPYINDVVKRDCDKKAIADLIKTRIETFCDIKEMIDFFDELPDYDTDMYVHKKMKTTKETSLAVLKELLPKFEELEDYSVSSIEALLMEYIKEKEVKNGYCLWPVRTAVSGKQSTPGGAYEIMSILGKEESLSRIRKGIEKLSC